MSKRKLFWLSLLAIIITIVSMAFLTASSEVAAVHHRVGNPDLKTILPSWQGTHVGKNGRFMNHEFPGKHSFKNVLKWQFQKNPQRELKKSDTWKMPVVKDNSFLHTNEDVIVALGHATFFIRLNGKQILIDPIFGELSMHTRYTDFPIETAQLTNIDYVLISHSHYDHCDKTSLKIIQSQNPNAVFLAG